MEHVLEKTHYLNCTKSIADINNMSIDVALDFFNNIKLSSEEEK